MPYRPDVDKTKGSEATAKITLEGILPAISDGAECKPNECDPTTRNKEEVTRTVGAPGGSDLGLMEIIKDAPSESVHPYFIRACKIVCCYGPNIDVLPCPERGTDLNVITHRSKSVVPTAKESVGGITLLETKDARVVFVKDPCAESVHEKANLSTGKATLADITKSTAISSETKTADEIVEGSISDAFFHCADA